MHNAHKSHTRSARLRRPGRLPPGPAGCLLQKATRPKPGDVAALPDTQKRTQGGSQKEETTSQTKERDNAPEKELNAMETGHPDAELETMGMRVVYALKGRADELGESRDQETEHTEVEIENKTKQENSQR